MSLCIHNSPQYWVESDDSRRRPEISLQLPRLSVMIYGPPAEEIFAVCSSSTVVPGFNLPLFLFFYVLDYLSFNHQLSHFVVGIISVHISASLTCIYRKMFYPV